MSLKPAFYSFAQKTTTGRSIRATTLPAPATQPSSSDGQTHVRHLTMTAKNRCVVCKYSLVIAADNCAGDAVEVLLAHAGHLPSPVVHLLHHLGTKGRTVPKMDAGEGLISPKQT